MSAMASQITSLTIVYSTVYSGTDQRKRQSSASLPFVRGIHRWPVNSPHKGLVTRKIFPYGDVIMFLRQRVSSCVYFMSPFNSFDILGITSESFLALVSHVRISILVRVNPPIANPYIYEYHDDVIKWKHFPRYWPFVRGIHRSPVNSPHKRQWRGAVIFSLICARINGWVNNLEAGNLRRYRAHCDVIVMSFLTS